VALPGLGGVWQKEVMSTPRRMAGDGRLAKVARESRRTTLRPMRSTLVGARQSEIMSIWSRMAVTDESGPKTATGAILILQEIVSTSISLRHSVSAMCTASC
jgi:hypothetical protein